MDAFGWYQRKRKNERQANKKARMGETGLKQGKGPFRISLHEYVFKPVWLLPKKRKCIESVKKHKP